MPTLIDRFTRECFLLEKNGGVHLLRNGDARLYPKNLIKNGGSITCNAMAGRSYSLSS